MTTLYLYRLNIIIPEADKDALNALMTAIAPEGDTEANTFGIPLSANGQLPATHRGASGSITEEMRVLIQDIFVDEFANCVIEITDYTENTWDAFLVSAKLKVIEPKDI